MPICLNCFLNLRYLFLFLNCALPSEFYMVNYDNTLSCAAIAQLGERQTEDLEVPGSIPGLGITIFVFKFK